MDRRTKAALNKDKAVRLNETRGVGAAQVRYSDDGHWYATLTRFPAALFDARGYVLFPTEEEYRTSPHMSIGKQISVPKPGRAYGSAASDYCEVHHLLPLSAVDHTARTRMEDLAILCANCHRVVHLHNPPYTLNQVRSILAQ
jgi:hypothetical protein